MNRSLVLSLAFGLVMAEVGLRSVQAADMLVQDAASFSAALSSARDGDQILLAPGTYGGQFAATGLTGVAIRSADPANPAVLDTLGGGEALKLSDPTRVTISDLVIQGATQNGITIDDGGAYDTPARDITLQNLVIHGIASNDLVFGVKLAGVDGLHVDHVRIDDWGGSGGAIGMVGVHDGLIENSYFENNTVAGGVGVQMKGGSSGITVRANRFVNASERPIQFGGSTALQYFRPQPPGTVEASNVVAEGNVIIGGACGVAYVNIDGGATFRSNLVYRPGGWVLRILKENDSPGFVDTQDGAFVNNIVEWNQGDLLEHVNSGINTQPTTFQFAGNQWYNLTSPANSTPGLPSFEQGGIVGVDPKIDLNGVIPWKYNWGLFLVNANDTAHGYPIAPGAGAELAVAGPGGTLDLGKVYPFIGNWSFTPVTDTSLQLAPFSYLFVTLPPVTWTGNGGPGNARWDVPANWSTNLVPDKVDVAFGSAFANGNTIDLGGAGRSVVGMTFTNDGDLAFENGALHLAGIRKVGGAGSVTFGGNMLTYIESGATIDNSGPGGQVNFDGAVMLRGAGVTFSGTQPVVVNGLLIDNGFGFNNNGTLLNSGTIQAAGINGSGQIALQAGAVLKAAYVRQNQLSIGAAAAATMSATPAANASSSTSRVSSLSIEGGSQPLGKLDLNNNSLIVDYSGPGGIVLASVTAQIAAGRNGKDANDQANWNGQGIVTSAGRAANVAAKIDLYNLGAINNGDLDKTGIGAHLTTFAGQSVAANTVLVKYTYSGDANLSGTVDGDDYTYWLNGFLGLTDLSVQGWLRGDFNYDGKVDGDDYTQWLNSYLFAGPPLAGADGPAAVPEPATVALLGCGVCIVVAYACYRRKCTSARGDRSTAP